MTTSTNWLSRPLKRCTGTQGASGAAYVPADMRTLGDEFNHPSFRPLPTYNPYTLRIADIIAAENARLAKLRVGAEFSAHYLEEDGQRLIVIAAYTDNDEAPIGIIQLEDNRKVSVNFFLLEDHQAQSVDSPNTFEMVQSGLSKSLPAKDRHELDLAMKAAQAAYERTLKGRAVTGAKTVWRATGGRAWNAITHALTAA